MDQTPFAGLTVLEPGDALVPGSAFTDRDVRTVDHYLQVGAVTHRHDAHAALGNPLVAPDLTVDPSAGQLPPATTFWVGFTLIDSFQGETAVSPLASGTTPPGLADPTVAPLVNVVYTSGTLTPATYYYAVTLMDEFGGETLASPFATVSVDYGHASATVLVTGLLALNDGNPVRVYRSTNGGEYSFVGSVASDEDQLVDDGAECIDCDIGTPVVNNTTSISRLLVTVPSAAVASAAGFGLYCSDAPDLATPALVGFLPAASAGVPIQISSPLFDPGEPPPVSASIPGANQIDPDTELIDWHWLRPVDTQASLAEGDNGDVRMAMDTKYIWTPVGSGGAVTADDWMRVPGTTGMNGVDVTDDSGGVASGAAIAFTASGNVGVSVSQNGGSAQVLIGSEDPTLYDGDELDWLYGTPAAPGTELAHIEATSAGAQWTQVTELTALSVPTSGFQSFALDTAHTSEYAMAEYSAGPRGGDVAGIGFQDPSGNVLCLTYYGGYQLWDGPGVIGSPIHAFSGTISTTGWIVLSRLGSTIRLEHWTGDPATGGTVDYSQDFVLTGTLATRFGGGASCFPIYWGFGGTYDADILRASRGVTLKALLASVDGSPEKALMRDDGTSDFQITLSGYERIQSLEIVGASGTTVTTDATVGGSARVTIAGAPGGSGASGVPGPPGPTGPAGPTGPTGATGPAGADGPPGASGAVGPQGPKGDKGDTGATGSAGASGAAGPQGPIGLTGAQGPTGATGPPGASGATGPQGASGAVGPAGPAGADGATGPAGPQGASGATGAQGASGATGATGATGAQGQPGGAVTIPYAFDAATADADPGHGKLRLNNATQDDSTVLRVSGFDADGVNWYTVIDFLFDASTSPVTGHVRLVKRDDPSRYVEMEITAKAYGGSGAYFNLSFATFISNWVNPFVAGDQLLLLFDRTGDKGNVGATGAAGATGATGPAGAQGPQGNPGPTGATGATGATGPQGATGASGAVGPPGATGPPGQGTYVAKWATTAALVANTHSGAGPTGTLTANTPYDRLFVDGQNPNFNDLVLVKNEALSRYDGLYRVTDVGTTSTPWILTREVTMSTAAQITGALVEVLNGGNTLGGTIWIQPNTVATIDTSSQGWQSTGAGATGATGPAGGTAPSVVVGDGAARTFTITHNLNSQEVQTMVRQTASPYEQVFPTVANSTANTVTLTFVTAPTSGQYTVTCSIGSAQLTGGSSVPAVIGDGATRVFTITHNLGSQEVDTNVRQSASPYEQVYPTIANTTVNTVTLTFAVAPSAGQYTVTCKVGVPQQLLTTINGPWTNITAFSNGWVAATYTPQYMIDAIGFVHLRGSIKNGTANQTAFTLPVGFRPANPPALCIAGQAGDLLASINVLVDGSAQVYINSPSTAEVELDTVSFLAASPVLVSSAPQLVTSLPASPTDRQEIYFLADATNGVVWHLRYRAASSSAYKWEFVGGPPLFTFDATSVNTASTTFVTLGTMPSLTVPLTGEYLMAHGFDGALFGAANGGGARASLFVTGADTGGYATTGVSLNQSADGSYFDSAYHKRKQTITAGTVVDQRYKQQPAAAAGAAVYFENRFIEITPVRVGP